MAKNNFEYKGKNFSIRWDSKEKILFIGTWGVHDEETAKAFMAKFREFYKMFPSPESYKVLTDVSRLIKTTHKARRLYTELIKLFPGGAKIVVCGSGTVIRVIVNFLLASVIKRENTEVKFFATTEEGLKWLKKT